MDNKFVCLFLWLTCCQAGGVMIPWSPDWMPHRQDLTCNSQKCDITLTANKGTEDNPVSEYDNCCTCYSQITWAGQEVKLYLEQVSRIGKSLVILDKPGDNRTVYKIEHPRRNLPFFPSNLCNWDDVRLYQRYKQYLDKQESFFKQIVTIDLSFNNLHELIDLNCLDSLDTLDLRNNYITAVSNTSIWNMTHLRQVYLQNNNIQVMDPTIISSPNLRLLNFDMTGNQLGKLDVTNMFSLYPFCELDYKSNKITELVNKLDMKPELNHSKGPGMVVFSNNNINTFPDFKDLLNLDKLSDLGQFFSFGFDMRDVKLACNCNLQPFMSIAKNITKGIWRSYMGVKCESPPELIGTFVVNVSLDLLTCNKTIYMDDLHKQSCTWTDKPQSDTLFIDCSSSGLTSFPTSVQQSNFSRFVHLDISNNSITKLEPTPYLPLLSHLILANNDLTEIDQDAASMLENISSIDLSNNPRLHSIPQTLKHHHVCNIRMANITLDCNCDTGWIQTWIKFKSCGEKATFRCKVPDHGVMLPEDFSTDVLDCDPVTYSLLTLSLAVSATAFLLIASGVISYWLRYEILICLLRARQLYGKSNAILPSLSYDAYISIDEDNDDLRKWACFTLVPHLEMAGYKLFVPLRDLKSGCSRHLEIIQTLSKTKTFLVILTDSYLLPRDYSWTDQEWKYGWHMFKTCREKQIVMVNYDQILPSEIWKPQIKAFVRVGGTVDFTNRKRDIMEQICKKLGPPTVRHQRAVTEQNRNVRLRTGLLNRNNTVYHNIYQ